MVPSKVIYHVLSLCYLQSYLVPGFLATRVFSVKPHLDWFSRFCTLTRVILKRATSPSLTKVHIYALSAGDAAQNVSGNNLRGTPISKPFVGLHGVNPSLKTSRVKSDEDPRGKSKHTVSRRDNIANKSLPVSDASQSLQLLANLKLRQYPRMRFRAYTAVDKQPFEVKMHTQRREVCWRLGCGCCVVQTPRQSCTDLQESQPPSCR